MLAAHLVADNFAEAGLGTQFLLLLGWMALEGSDIAAQAAGYKVVLPWGPLLDPARQAGLRWAESHRLEQVEERPESMACRRIGNTGCGLDLVFCNCCK